jgi:hypothetical protein
MSDARPQGVIPAHGHDGHRADVIDTRGIGRFTVWLVVSLVIIHVVLGALYGVFKLREDQADKPPLPMQVERELRAVPGPQLRADEIRPYQLMVETYRRQQKILAESPKVDAQTGVGQIPIEHAMRLVAEGRRAEIAGTQPAADHSHAGHEHATPPAREEGGTR